MKLICKEVYCGFEELFTVGKSYDVKVISPNAKMVSVACDDGCECSVVYQTSVYGKFTLEKTIKPLEYHGTNKPYTALNVILEKQKLLEKEKEIVDEA